MKSPKFLVKLALGIPAIWLSLILNSVEAKAQTSDSNPTATQLPTQTILTAALSTAPASQFPINK
jgi:hypothetical protein